MAEIKRPNYFTSQFLVEKDFNDEQAYHLNSRRRHNRLLHTSGVAEGLDVRFINGRQIQVGVGTAVDGNGREIVLADPQIYTLGTVGNGLDVYLTIAYQDALDPADQETQGLDKFTRTTERPLLQDGAAVPPADGSVIVLARIRLNSAGLLDSAGAIDMGVRALSSAKLGPAAVTGPQLGDGAVSTTKLADAAVRSAKLANYAVGSAKLDGFARGQHGVFFEAFEELPSDWTAVEGAGVESIVANGEAGGKALHVVGYRWRVFPQNIPFDPSKLYRIRARFRPIARSSDPTKENVHLGVEGVAADGVTLVNVSGQNTTGNQHYLCVSALNTSSQPLGNWLEFTSWFRGHAAAGSQGTFPNPTTPAQLHTNVRYFRPLFIFGFSGGDGTAELDSIAIDVFDESGVVRTYSGLNADGTVAADRVVTNSIAAGAVTTPKLADLNVTGAKLATNAVDASKIQDGAIGTSKLADGATTLTKLASNSVDGSKIVSGSIGANQLANASVLGQHIGAGAISADKLQFGSVGISALAVQPGFNSTFTIGPNTSTIFVLSSQPDIAHQCFFVSVIALTPGCQLNWHETASASAVNGFFSRIITVTNITGVFASFSLKSSTLLV